MDPTLKFNTLHSKEATVYEKKMNNTRKKTKFLVLLTMFCSIELVLMFTPLGFIPIGPVRATTMHIPVILAGMLLGVKGGAITGLIFGLSSVLINTITPTITSFVFTPFYSLGDYHGNIMSLVIAIGPRVFLGVMSALIYAWFKKRDKNIVGSVTTTLICTIMHSVLVLGMIYLFFGPSYASAKGVDVSELFLILIGLIATNSVLEAILAAFVTTPLVKVLDPMIKKVM